MSHRRRRSTLVLAVLAAVWIGSAAAEPDDLEWLVGTWTREGRRGVIHELWERVSDRTIEGESWIVATADGKTYPIESLLIVEFAGELYYIPKVAENEYPVPFRRTSSEPGTIVFDNPTHDFPQRIIYQRTGDDAMTVTIEGPGDGDEPHTIEFSFHRTN